MVAVPPGRVRQSSVNSGQTATGDLDIWIDSTPANGPLVMRALASFGAPLHDITERDFSRPGVVFQIGLPPGRIDVLTELTGLTFEEAWPARESGQFGEITVDFLERTSKGRQPVGRRPPRIDGV